MQMTIKPIPKIPWLQPSSAFSIILCLGKYHTYRYKAVFYFSKNLSVHLMHKLSVDVKSQTVAFFVLSIFSSPEALKNVRQFVFRKGTATIPDCNKQAPSSSEICISMLFPSPYLIAFSITFCKTSTLRSRSPFSRRSI